MILKSFEVKKINQNINHLILFYGKNEGLKNDAINLSNDWDWNIHAHNLQNELECLFKNSKTICCSR